MDGEHDPAEAVAVVLREIHDVLAHTETQGTSDYFAEARRRLESPEPEAVASSGLPKWDKAGGPFLRAGELLVIGARPGMGKTILSLQAAAATATLGKCVLFVSLEMPPDQLLLRLAQSRAGEEGVIRPCMDAEDEARAKAARLAALRSVEADIGDRLQFLTCSESTTLNAIEARARLLAASRSDLSLIVIDYLQLIPPPEGLRKDTRERQVAEMSRRLKLLALNLGVPIIVLSQLNREGAQTAAPDLCNLRESGAIEQDADVVWLLYPHPDRFAYDGEESRTSTVLLTQAKARNGPAGIHYELTLQRECLKFSER
jgi:replicative DNA helicase